MKKNCQKGYFLVETIISLTVVATIITVLYAAIISSYIKQNNEITKFNTIEGVYVVKEIDKFFKNDLDELKSKITDTTKYVDLNEYVVSNNAENNEKFNEFKTNLNIDKLYFSNYDMAKLIDEKINVSMKKNLKLENEKDTNRCNYRYLIIFNDKSYATTGVDCN